MPPPGASGLGCAPVPQIPYGGEDCLSEALVLPVLPVLPVLSEAEGSEAEGSGAEGCRPAFPNNEGKNKDTGCPIKPGMTEGWIPDPPFCHSRARGNPGSLFSRGIRQEGRAPRPAPTRRHPDPVGDDLQPALSGAEGCRPVPALPVLSEAEGSVAEGCRPASFQTTETPKHWMPDRGRA